MVCNKQQWCLLKDLGDRSSRINFCFKWWKGSVAVSHHDVLTLALDGPG